MRAKAAAVLAAGCCLLSFALGRFSLLQSGAWVGGGKEALQLPALVVSDAPHSDEAPAFGPIDINTAGVEELCLLPQVGEKTAEKIIAYREQNGPFASCEELMAVSGIGPATYEGLCDYIICTER